MKTRDIDRMAGWVVWRLLLTGRVGEHQSLFPCLCPYLGVEMHERGSGLSPSLVPQTAESSFAAQCFRSAQCVSKCPQRYIATRRCHSTCCQSTLLNTVLIWQNQAPPSSRLAQLGREQRNPGPDPQLGSSRAAQALTQHLLPSASRAQTARSFSPQHALPSESRTNPGKSFQDPSVTRGGKKKNYMHTK